MLKFFIPIIAVLSLSACEPASYPEYQPNQITRQKVFKECMALVPKGPMVTGSENPWDKVIDSCADAAYRQSLECVINCPEFKKPE